jgi:hypothetical protein
MMILTLRFIYVGTRDNRQENNLTKNNRTIKSGKQDYFTAQNVGYWPGRPRLLVSQSLNANSHGALSSMLPPWLDRLANEYRPDARVRLLI